jgi:CBS domain containing-hemolysin-like protein
MTLLIIYVLIALGFSFLCSVAEAVFLSVTPAYIALLRKNGRAAGEILAELKTEVNRPLAAILTLNTIAHTVGAAGAGAQAAAVFGNAYLGVASAVLTFLILVLSEIIPKTLGATYWRSLAPATAHGLRVLVWLLWPFVKLSEWITGRIAESPRLTGFSRQEFAAMAELSAEEGELRQAESRIVQNLLNLRQVPVTSAMTPRTVVFSLPDSMTVAESIDATRDRPFSRIPIYHEDNDDITGFVLRSHLLMAQLSGRSRKPLDHFRRNMPSLPESLPLARAFNSLQEQRAHMALVVDEYGDWQGILTLEDVMETLLGLEIVDESDLAVDMQELARRKWRRRARAMGLGIEPED